MELEVILTNEFLLHAPSYHDEIEGELCSFWVFTSGFVFLLCLIVSMLKSITVLLLISVTLLLLLLLFLK